MLSDTVDTTTDAATEAPAQTAQPPEVLPPTNSHRTAGWFAGGWRYGIAAAIVVLVAGAFFTIGWFTSTRGDHGHFATAHEIRQRPYVQEQPGSGDQTSPQTTAPANPQTPSYDPGYLGVGVTTVTPALQQQYGLSRADGVLITNVDRTGPAAAAGIQRGDIITSIDRTAMATQQDVVNLVSNKNAGDSISVVVDRDGQSLTFQVTLAARTDIISG